MYTENERVRYKKKSSKTSKKSKHKHIYKECLFFDEKLGNYHKGSYCTICGKIFNFNMCETEKIDNKRSRVLSQTELLDKYKDLEIIKINNLVRAKIIPSN